MKRWTGQLAAAGLLLASGCATSLSVQPLATATAADGSSQLDAPSGIPVNLRASYDVVVDTGELAGMATPAARLVGVDEERMIAVDLRRQAFASGNLKLELNGAQQIRKLEITGEPGAARGVIAVKEALSARGADAD